MADARQNFIMKTAGMLCIFYLNKIFSQNSERTYIHIVDVIHRGLFWS